MDVIGLGKEVGKVLNNIFAQLPTRDQRVMKSFYKFLDEYHLEINRDDCDHDDLILWKQRKDDLIDTILTEMRR